MDLREVGCDPGDWIDLTEDREQWRIYLRVIMNLRVLKSQLVSYASIGHNNDRVSRS